MRIISGQYRGIQLKGFQIEGTRPTMDRVKESLFAMIQDKIKDSIVLDLFAGSGSLGFEALSNYATKSYLVDHNKIAISTMEENKKKIKCEDKCEIWKMDFMLALRKYKTQKIKFDIIFLDPPYQLHYINQCLDFIEKNDLLNENGLVICEYETEVIRTNLNLWKQKIYGQTKISIYQK